jgi:hypothetical protein
MANRDTHVVRKDGGWVPSKNARISEKSGISAARSAKTGRYLSQETADGRSKKRADDGGRPSS